MAKTRFSTPPGEALHAWIDKPDTKFNADGLFKTKLILDLNESLKDRDGNEVLREGQPVYPARDWKAKVDAQAQAAFDEELKDLSVGARKKWGLYLPYTEEEDDEGNPTGRIIFEFKRNAKIKIRKTGEIKELTVACYNVKGEPIKSTAVFSGTIIIVGGVEFRPIKITASQKAGVRMDFSKVQILKLRERTDNSFGDQSAQYGDWNAETDDDDADDKAPAPFDASSDY